MKLIDLLVQELPKRGGWPEGTGFIAADGDGAIDSYVHKPELDRASKSWVDNLGDGYHEYNVVKATEVCDWDVSVISEEEYEAALAASKQVEWSGEGLPPVGLQVEYTCQRFSPHNQAILEGHWYFGTIIAYYEGFVWTSDDGIRPLHNTKFRPIRTEAERKREDSIKYISHSLRANGSITDEQLNRLYDDIATGNIIGIKLAD